MTYKHEAREEEWEVYTEDDYREMLRECYGETVNICGIEYDTADTLEEVDPTAFRCGFNDFQEYEIVYICPICGSEHEDEDAALDCCEENIEEDDENE